MNILEISASGRRADSVSRMLTQELIDALLRVVRRNIVHEHGTNQDRDAPLVARLHLAYGWRRLHHRAYSGAQAAPTWASWEVQLGQREALTGISEMQNGHSVVVGSGGGASASP